MCALGVLQKDCEVCRVSVDAELHGPLETEDPRAWGVQTRSTPHIYEFPSTIIYIHTHYFPLDSYKNFVKQTD